LLIRSYWQRYLLVSIYGDKVSNNIQELITTKNKNFSNINHVPNPQDVLEQSALDRANPKSPSFQEKPGGDGAWINGGYFCLRASVIDYIADDSTAWGTGVYVEKLFIRNSHLLTKHDGSPWITHEINPPGRL